MPEAEVTQNPNGNPVMDMDTNPDVSNDQLPSDGPGTAVPDKFMRDGKPDYDALVKSYNELESNFSKMRQGQLPSDQQQPTTDGEENQVQEEQQSLDGDKMRSFLEAVQKNDGQIPDDIRGTTGLGEEYEELLAAGTMNQKASAIEAVANEVLQEHFGGEQGFTAAINWAKDNWSEEEAKAFNDAANNADKDPGTFKILARTLAAAYRGANGQTPQRTISGAPATGGGDVYHSDAQMLEDMRDPRYKSDEHYRNAVEAKLARSVKAGTM